MLSIEQSLVERLPWLAQYPAIRRPVAGMLGRLADEDGFNRVLDRVGTATGFDFVERVLDVLGTSYHVNSREREHIPIDGPLLVVANHPLGMQDALALLQLIGSVRSDVRMLGNDWLATVPQLGRLLLPVDVFGKGAASRLRGIYRALDNGEALIVFPAGEVSRMRADGVRDGRWSDGFARLSLRRKVPVLPVHVAARNSTMFYGMSMLARPLSTAMLPREAVASGSRRIGFSIGALVTPAELEQRSAGSSTQAARLMRRHVYRVGRHRGLIFGGQAPLAHPEPAAQVAAELARAEKLADLGDGKQALLFKGVADSTVLREIGRLRELTFRKVGEGTGERRDLDAWDPHYEHLVLWDPQALRIVGAYRLGHGGRLICERGMAGLYTSSLFHYSPALESRLAQGLELGRSFIAPAYWRSRALDQLWQGIGLYLQRHPELRYLFGPVSMSVSLPREAREWIAAAHQHYFGAPGLAAARQPFVISAEVIRGVQLALAGLDASAGLGKLKHHLDALGVSLPVLYRQYVDLVEPDGVQFLDFGEDPGFSGCVDGLVMLDLAALKPLKRARYLGKSA
ncbi:lysophospholipid acyltransferase family protein [Rhodanobacter sp. C03]|uniref:GNAT family N-acyltransferase n=1 Tax=Rhodanobacter sp. C03 TaxID=1945858 RepID=UPI000987707F|nr:lysophospholipid acyltransferase family protein [Rhodanobacter sp. C03]OOG54449.1 glycerol acyltransferase [Rhodanobacter sp. C03]